MAKKDKAKDKVKKTKSTKDTKAAQRLEELEIEHIELKDKHLRLFAEFDNFKKRTAKERIDLRTTATQELVSALLPILDDFDRAKMSAEDENSEEVFTDGVNLVYNKLNSILDVKGLKAMKSDGETFDPELHEAVTNAPAPSEDLKGKVMHTVEKGYFLGEKIIRHAKVVVGN